MTAQMSPLRQVVVELVGGPQDGRPGGLEVPVSPMGTLPPFVLGRYHRSDRVIVMRSGVRRPVYDWIPGTGSARPVPYCRCGNAGCPSRTARP